MPKLEGTLIQNKVDGVFNESEHHNIAAKLKAMSDKWDKIEEKTGIRPPEAFDYSFGLIMGKELIFHTSPEHKDSLKQKIEAVKWQ